MNEEKYDYWLSNVPGLKKKTRLHLFSLFHSSKALYHASFNTLKKISNITPEDIEKLIRSRQSFNIDSSFDLLKSQGIRYISVNNIDYPLRLREIPDCPLGLYVKGSLPADNKPSVAIIGARTCSEYGKHTAFQFSKELSSYGIQIISGMAKGIDGISHIGALAGGGSTFGILGCGVDICYPKEHRQLYADLVHRGGLISEYPLGSPPLAKQFPPRNRIISGLSDIVLVVESKLKSGTSITVEMALEQGRDVYAVPGRVTDTFSTGCNLLIKQGASIALSVSDILSELNIDSLTEQFTQSSSTLTDIEKQVFLHIDYYPTSLEYIYKNISELGYTLPQLMQLLLSLELKGFIKEICKNNYSKIYKF